VTKGPIDRSTIQEPIMKRKAALAALAAALLGCADAVTDPTAPIEKEAQLETETYDLVLDRRIPSRSVLNGLFGNATRVELANGVAHYRFTVPLGPREFDHVRIHRVVRERRPHHPVKTRGAVFMAHGAYQDFEGVFLDAGTEHPGPETSAAAFLAANDIDVWGMDFGWTRIPEAATDLSFMEDWGVERDADRVLAAMSVARLLRGLTDQGFGRLNLLGFSYGAVVAYAAAGRETRQPAVLRDVRGLIAVDAGLKLPVESARLAACGRAENIAASLETIYVDSTGIRLATLAHLASTSPNHPSPILPPALGLTNLQAMLSVARNFFAAFFDADGVPVDLRYTDVSRVLATVGSSPPYMPLRAMYETALSRCDEEDVSIDDHLAEISVPILHLGAAGGNGIPGAHTAGLTASDDVTRIIVQLLPSDQAAIDYGHQDLFMARDAADRVWPLLRGWIIDRSREPQRWNHTIGR
jgi:pimeloyl-ACP methyl ester carboxylesterase